LVLQALDAGSGGGKHDVGATEGSLAFIARVDGIGGDDLAEEAADLLLERRASDARAETADDIEPLRLRVRHVVHAEDGIHGLDRQIVIGRG